MRLVILYLLLALLPTWARAETYVEKKDSEAIAAVERSLAKVDKDPSMFDGTTIPDGAQLSRVKRFYDELATNLRAAGRSLDTLSATGAARPEAQKLRARFDDLERYRAALGPLIERALADAGDTKREHRAEQQQAARDAGKVCAAFRAELRKSGQDYEKMGVLTHLADGQNLFWQNVEDGEKFRGALERTAALCQRMPAVGDACARASNVVPLDARYCETAAKGPELMKAGVKNLIAHLAETLGPARIIGRFEKDLGYLEVDGVTTWTAYFSGAKLKDLLAKKVGPVLAQAGMAASDADALFDKLGTEYAELEAKARDKAPTWDLPGAPCTGPGCTQAKKFLQQWYRGATIKRFHHTQPGWKILTDDIGTPTYRERYGYALVQVKGDPFCQLRLWTYSEPYAGGGRYTPGRDVTLHTVRWQTCK